MTKTREIIGYQMLAQSQVMHYNGMDVPEAKFSYDLSPMAVNTSGWSFKKALRFDFLFQ